MANITTQTIRVDLSTDKVLPTAFTHQNDTARTLEFSMYNKGVPYTMTGNTVKFAYKSPIVDGAYTVITGSGMASGTVSGNKVTVTLPSEYTAISGVGMLTMIITPTSGTVRPVNIRLVVQKSADGDDTVMGASDFPVSLYEYMDDWLEENEPTEIANLKSDLNALESEAFPVIRFNWVHGGIDNATGETNHNGSLSRSRDETYYKVSDLHSITNGSASALWVILYTESNGTYSFLSSSKVSEGSTYYFDTGDYVRFDIRGSLSEAALVSGLRESKIVNDVIQHTEDIAKFNNFAYAEPIPTAVLYSGQLWRNSTQAFITSANGFCKKVTVEPNTVYIATTSMAIASDGFALIDYFDSSNAYISSEYPIAINTSEEITLQTLNVPSNASWFYINGRVNEPQVYTLEKTNESLPEMLNVNKIYLNGTPVESELIAGKLYRYSTQALINSADGFVVKVPITSGLKYVVTTGMSIASTGFALIDYFDSSDAYITSEFLVTRNINRSVYQQQLTIPNNASWMYVNGRVNEPQVYTLEVPTKTLPEVTKDLERAEKQISILFVGNSLTQDGMAYVPYLLKNYYPEIKFKFYIWYNGGYTLAQQYQKMINNQACEIFSIAENTYQWRNTARVMSNVLQTCKFDIVCLQEYFNYKESYTEADLVDFNNCRDYITANYTGGNSLKFVTLFHAPLRSETESVYNLTMNGVKLILQKTIAESMIPSGIAIYKALSTSLDSLGDQGHLSPDGTHAQEGLPCLLQSFAILCWIFNELAIPKSVYGSPIRMDSTIYDSINVPGANLGSGIITGTDEQNLLAQQIAIEAYKESKYITDNNTYHE